MAQVFSSLRSYPGLAATVPPRRDRGLFSGPQFCVVCWRF
jgi:hypothetical protein